MNVRHELSRLEQTLTNPQYLRGASLFRIVAGTSMLLLYLVNYPQRGFLYGPHAVFPFDLFRAAVPVSAYAWSSHVGYFELVFHGALLINLLWLLGIGTVWLGPLHAFLTFSLQRRAPGVFDGGDNFICIVLVYVCAADVSAHYSLRALARGAIAPKHHPLRAVLHNVALAAVALQLCTVYAVAGLSKVMGSQWPGGVALYHSTRMSEFYRPGLSELVYRSEVVSALAAYAAVALQVSFTFLFLLNRYTRLLAILAGICFHAGIALVMGLVTFALFMISADLCFLSDRELRAVGRGFRSMRAWLWRLPRKLSGLPGARAVSRPH